MERDVKQLVEMVSLNISNSSLFRSDHKKGATAAQARAALKQYKDVMQAAERIFDGAFDDILDETDMRPENAIADKKARMIVGTLATMLDGNPLIYTPRLLTRTRKKTLIWMVMAKTMRRRTIVSVL